MPFKCLYSILPDERFFLFLWLIDEATLEEMFKCKEVKPREAKPKSKLSDLLEQSRTADPKCANAFDEYKQFDGEVRSFFS